MLELLKRVVESDANCDLIMDWSIPNHDQGSCTIHDRVCEPATILLENIEQLFEIDPKEEEENTTQYTRSFKDGYIQSLLNSRSLMLSSVTGYYDV